MKAKNKKCIECEREDLPHFSKKRCVYCARKSYGSIKKITPQTQKKKQEKKEKLDPYFFYHISMCKWSESSGVPISSPTKANICHLADKANHPSIMANLDNYVYLTIDEHARFDQLLLNHEFSKIASETPKLWKTIVPRFKKILPLCKENTKFVRAISTYITNSA